MNMKKKKETSNHNRDIIFISIVTVIIIVAYAVITQYFTASLNQYEMTATAIEENATHSAENNGDIYAVTATRMIFQATASPGYFATEAANREIAEAATAEYWETQGITPTPDEIELTDIAFVAGLTQTVETQLASGCILSPAEARRLVVDYSLSLDAPQIRDEHLEHDYVICPDDEQTPEWMDDDYILIVYFPDNTKDETIVKGVSQAIEMMPDYPLDISTISSGLTSFFIQNSNRQTFLYDDAIAALEAGLRGQELLDELGIVVEMP